MSPPLGNLLAAFRDVRVLVIGDAMLDTYLEGSTRRLCREAPVPIVALDHRTDVPGGAANVASNAASLGARVAFLSAVGGDAEGGRVGDILSARGIDVGGLVADRRRTTLTKQRVIADGQMLVRFDHGSTEPVDENVEEQVISRLGRVHAEVDVIVAADYGYGVLTPRVIAHLAALQARRPRILLVDAKDLPAYRLAGVTAAKPNYEEAARLLDLPVPNTTDDRARAIADGGDRLLALTGARLAAVTIDTEGALVLERGGTPYRTYARPVRHARAAGAGDTFGAAFALALAAGADMPAAAELASAAAAVVVAKDGTAVCSAAELGQSLATDSKIISARASLPSCVEAHRRERRRLVFTNGCFDILHRGHIDYLNRAKALGDVLIVGVNSDAGVRRLKGPERPINPLADRMAVLAALSCVDHIVAFDEDTPEDLIRVIRPNSFVKGADYTREQLPEAGLVEALGGRVHLMPHLEDRSTSDIIMRIRREPAA
jgi:D-beta-D-heptose 7-phosphate kinase/D-beta-D-heptose 1-phosphate adenosyltransferase